MSFNAADLLRRLVELEGLTAPPKRFVIALSGGLDSTVLAHMLSTTRQEHGISLHAVHVDHRMQADSRSWARHCKRFAAELDLEFVCEVTGVDLAGGDGPEAAARDARYAALEKHVDDGDWLLSAHHGDDQAETLLLNLLRGSGPAGLAGMQAIRSFASGWLVRPLLDVPRDELVAYAVRKDLSWIDDPSNADRGYDRNFLRSEVLPLLKKRWPHAGTKLARSAELARDSSNLLADLAALDIAAIGGVCNKLPATALGTLSPPRQRNLLRYAAQISGLPAPAAVHLQAILEQLLPAREDAEPLVSWLGGEARRYRDTVYLQPTFRAANFKSGASLVAGSVRIGPGLGVLTLGPGDGPGLSEASLARGLSVRRREGGEEIKPVGQAHTRKLKKLLQEEGVLPWLRNELPLVYSGDYLVAVADLWIAADAAAENGPVIHWRDRPDLY